MNRKKISALAMVLTTVALSSCDSGKSNSGSDHVATQCVAFGQAEKLSSGYRHTIHNTCDKNINVYDVDSNQRFSVLKRKSNVIILPSLTPKVGACFDPFAPEVLGNGTEFKCVKP